MTMSSLAEGSQSKEKRGWGGDHFLCWYVRKGLGNELEARERSGKQTMNSDPSRFKNLGTGQF